MFLPYHKTVLVLVLGIDLGHLEVLVLVLGIDLSHLEVLVLVLTSRDLVLLTSGTVPRMFCKPASMS